MGSELRMLYMQVARKFMEVNSQVGVLENTKNKLSFSKTERKAR